MMVDGLRMLLRRIRPGFEYLQDEKVELVDEPGIDHLALAVTSASTLCCFSIVIETGGA
jgi:hypothetical protein